MRSEREGWYAKRAGVSPIDEAQNLRGSDIGKCLMIIMIYATH